MVAAIAILGTVLAGIVLAKSKHTRQLSLSMRKAEAVLLADALIATWWSGEEGVPVGATGPIEGSETMTWRTQTVPSPSLDGRGARVVRVTITEQPLPVPGAREGDEVLVTVDLVVENPEFDAVRRAEREKLVEQAKRRAERGAGL